MPTSNSNPSTLPKPMLSRSAWIAFTLILSLSFSLANQDEPSAPSLPAFTAAKDIRETVKAARPMHGGTLPADFNKRFGATHFAGRYHLTDKPFLLEGLQTMHDMGMRSAKLWFSIRPATFSGYSFNSNWSAMTDAQPPPQLVDLAKTEYFHKAFSMPFETFALVTRIASTQDWSDGPDNDAYFADVEEQHFRLAKHLLQQYRDREVTFILQNWEGDWLLRGEGGTAWEENPSTIPPAHELNIRIASMIRWFKARQNGVTRARAEVTDTKAIVAHAIEVNKIWDVPNRRTLLESNIPCLTTHVVPHVPADLVFWSAYEGRYNMPVSMWQGIEFIRHFTNASELYGNNNVAIGEIGLPEQIPAKTAQELLTFWDSFTGVMLAMDIPWFFHWQLYCNSPIDEKGVKIKGQRGQIFPTEELRGLWLVKPDGTFSHAGAYFKSLLDASRQP